MRQTERLACSTVVHGARRTLGEAEFAVNSGRR